MKIFRSLKNAPAGSLVKDIAIVILMFAIWRGALFAFDFIGMAMTVESVPPEKDYQAFRSNWFLDSWARWDSGWYKRIVERGYFIEGSQSNVAFFPLYPYLTKGLSYFIGNHWIAGLIISNLSLLISLFYMLRIARMYLDEEGARRTLVYILLFPTSFFFSAYYTEGLFLMTTTASFYYYLKEKYFAAGLFGLLATMTRSTGIALFGAYVLGYLWNKRLKVSQMSASVLWIFLIPMGIVAFMIILNYQVGDPIAFSRYQSGWGRSIAFPIATIIRGFGELNFHFPRGDWHNADVLLCLVSAILFLLVPLVNLGKVDMALTLYSLALIVIPLTTGSLLSLNRFVVVAFPAFLGFARLGENRRVDRFIVFAFTVFLGFYTLQFANWHWVG